MSKRGIIYLKLLPVSDEPTRKLVVCTVNETEQVIEISILDANPAEVAMMKLDLGEYADDHLLNVINTQLSEWIRRELINYLEYVVEPNRHMKPIYDTIQLMQDQYRTEYGGEQ